MTKWTDFVKKTLDFSGQLFFFKSKTIQAPPHVRATPIFRNYKAIVTGKQKCLATEWRRPPWKQVCKLILAISKNNNF